MKIGFSGLGKLGLPCALAVESRGHEVAGFDINEQVLTNIRARKLPYHEAGAQEALDQTGLRLLSLAEMVSFAEIIFVPIQTPHEPKFEGVTRLPQKRADFDYTYLKQGISALAEEIARQRKDKIVAIISTVLPGTIDREIRPLLSTHIQLCYNPFFIAMGTTMDDFLHPEFILLGVDDANAAETVKSFYASIHSAPVFQTDIASAELAKVAYNTYISMKICFINTMMEICHKTDANIDAVSDTLALAGKRIMSPAYLRGGMGDGGGCHPRDNIALSWLARKLDIHFDFFEAIMLAREKQTEYLADLMLAHDLPKVILGKSFKPESNIVVGSPSLLLHALLKERGIDCMMWDPFVDDSAMPDYPPSVFLIGTKHANFVEMHFPQGSVIIDPWRYIPDQDDVEVIRVGE